MKFPTLNTTKGLVVMPKKLTEEYSDRLMELLIRMGMPRETCLEVWTVIETPEALQLFLDKLSEKNYEMTPEELYQVAVDTVLELQ